MNSPPPVIPQAAVVGGGPAGLMACQALLTQGCQVTLYDAMPSLGRKFLLAGRGGLNLTHSEDLARFGTRYGSRQAHVSALLERLPPAQVRRWAEDLGISTFEGSSGRIFPREMKAAPLLRAWLRRLRGAGLTVQVRHRWCGWSDDGSLLLEHPGGRTQLRAAVTVLALGGGSWRRLGSDGAWVPLLRSADVRVADLKPSNCGFHVSWGEYFRERYAGTPLKTIAASWHDASGRRREQAGELMITGYGLEGGVVYTASAALRDAISAEGQAVLTLDLLPGWSQEQLVRELSAPRGRRSWPSHLAVHAGLKGAKAALIYDALSTGQRDEPQALARIAKALPVTVAATRPLDEAISSAGGVLFEDLDEHLMVRSRPGLFCAGEMLDWEAPTGGYLLTACLASGRVAGEGAAAWLGKQWA